MFVLVLLASHVAYATNYTVTDTSDSASDTGSLRYAISQVNGGSGGDTITFASNVIGTITLINGTLTINQNVTITGPGAALLAISGGGSNGNNVAFRTNATVTISNLSIVDNNTVTGPGTGFVGSAVYNNGTLTLIACNISNNTAGDGGGAIGNQGTLTVEYSILSGNTGKNNVGGGIENSGTLTVESSTISGNKSDSNGGGIYNNGTLSVDNSTIYGNSGSNGGGIYSENGMGTTSLTVANATISGNTASGTDGGIDNASGTLSVSNSIVSGNAGGNCSACGTTGNLIDGTADLGPLQYNGGITQTMMPLPGSPAIGAGSGSSLSTDQRGFVRSGGASDLGAVQTNYLTVTRLLDSDDGSCGTTCSLRDAMNAAISDYSGDIIFQPGLTGTIRLTGSLPSVTAHNLNIEGPGANQLTIDGGGSYLVMDLSGTVQQVNLSGVTIANGNVTAGYSAGIANSGILIAENVAFNFNTGSTGGAIYNDGTLVLQNSTFNRNTGNGGAINNTSTGKLVVANSTFNGNRAYSTNGGALENDGGVMLVSSSTISGNLHLNSGTGAGISNDNGGALLLVNSIVSGNLDYPSTEDDCNNCGTQSSYNLIGTTANLNLGALAYTPSTTATVKTMLPLPGSAAIQAGDPTQLLAGVTTDERGFPRLTNGNLDMGAAQTNYTAVDFAQQQPSNTLVNANITPAVEVEVLETNTTSNATDAVNGIPITLSLNGSGALGGTLTQTTSGGVATFADLAIDTAGTGDTLATAPITVSSGFTLPAVTSNSFDITLITPTVSFSPVPSTPVIYGAAPITLSAMATSSGASTGQTITYQVDSGPGTISGNVLTITGVGTVVVEADAAANGTYALADTTANIVVNQANLTVTATDASRAYGAANPIFTGTYTGAVNGDTFTVSGTTTATAISGVGPYPITPTATGTNLANYTVTYVPGTLTVTTAALTVAATNATRVYGAANPAFTGSVTGAVSGDTFTVSGSTTATTTSGVGPYPITPTATGTNLANYTVTYAPGTLTVSAAPLTVTADNATRAYGAANPTFTGSVTGAVNGDSFTISDSTAATVTSGVGSYSITPTATGANLANYTVTPVNGTLTVYAVTLTLVANNATRAYGAANPAFTGTYTGAVNGDTFTVSGTTTATATSAVGPYPITPTATGAHLADYTVAPANGVLTVTVATPTVNFNTPLPTSATYGQQINLGATATSSGTSTGQAVQYQVNSGSAVVNGNVLTITGVQPVQVEAYVAQSGNYGSANATGTIATVTPASLTLTVANATDTYGSPNNPVFTGTAVGLKNGDVLSGNVNYSTTATPTSSVGTYPITATPQGMFANDYALTVVPGILTVTQAVLTVTGDSQNSPYGTPNRSYYSSVTGQWNNDTFTVSYSTTATQNSPVGTYAVVPTVSGPNLADYTVVTTNGSLNIIPENLFVVAANATRVYGTPNPAFSATVTGAVNGDTFTPTFTTVAAPSSDAGRYDIAPSVTSADIANYAVYPTVGILTVTQAATNLSLAASANQSGTGSPVTLTATASTAASGAPSGTVVFSANNTAIGAATLNAQGVATLTVSSLPAGSNTITATYPETRNFLGSTAQLNAPVVIGTPTFTLSSGPSSLAVSPGQAGLLTLNLTPMFGYTGIVNLSCSGLSKNSQCSFQPSSITLGGSATVNVPVLIEIGPLGLKQGGNKTAQLHRPSPAHNLPLLLPAVIFWLPGAEPLFDDRNKQLKRKSRSKSGKMLLLIALLAISAGMLGLSGCVGMSPFTSGNNPAPGQQTITITATGSNGVSQSIAVQVTVE